MRSLDTNNPRWSPFGLPPPGRAAALVLGLVACAPPPAKPPPPPAEPARSGPTPLATVALDADPIELFGITFEGHGPNLARLTLSSAPSSCDPAPRADDERRLTLTIVRELGNQGRWRVARLEAATPKHHGASVFTLADAPALEAGPSVEGKVRVSSHFNIPVRLDDQTVRLEVDADLPAIACGSLAPSDAPASHPDLTLAIAEETIPIHGAVYRRDAKTGQHRIVLATSPLDCSEQLGETEVGVTLVLDRIGRSVESVALGGLRLDDRPTTPLGKSPIRTSLRGLGKSVRVTFDGAAEVAGLDLALSGQATATYCR